MTLRAAGAFNGLLPEPTDVLIAYIRDPAKAPYLKYTQLVPAPAIAFRWAKMDPDDAVRLVDLNQYSWAYGDYRPTGRGENTRFEWIDDSVQRWDFPYTIDEETLETWQRSGIGLRAILDRQKMNQAVLHRAQRVVTALTGATWGPNTADLNTLMGTSGVYLDQASGTQYDPATGVQNLAFRLIMACTQKVKRIINLSTNAALNGEELIMVLPPKVAQILALSGEMFEALKQSQYAKDLTEPILKDWNLLPSYGGFSWVVEDSPRCYVNQKADGTIADVTVSSQKDYIYHDNSILFVSRPGGLDGGYGHKNYSTVQCYHKGGEAKVEAFSKPEHHLVESHVVLEDKVVLASTVSGFLLTNVINPAVFAAF